MLKTIFSKAFSVGFAVGKVMVFFVGLAVVVGLTLAMGTDDAEAKVPSLKEGVVNTVNTVTSMVGSLADPILRLDNNGDGPALDLQVEQGKTPMTLNSDTKVENLNADKLDGQDSSAFMPGSIYQKQESKASDCLSSNICRQPMFTVNCDSGDVTTGGGFASVDFGTNVTDSRPNANGTGWTVGWQDDSSKDTVSIYVLCADFPPAHTA